MNSRFFSLLIVLTMISFLRADAQIIFESSPNSSILVNGQNPYLTVNSPDDGVLDTLTLSGGVYTVTFSASVDSFVLGAQTVGDFPCESSEGPQYLAMDTSTWKGGGQFVIVLVDDGAARVVTNTSTPVEIPVPANTPGPHTVISCLVRSWDDSIKNVNSISPTRQTRLYSVRTFYVDTITGTHAIDTTIPLLTAIAPLDTATYIYHPDSVLLDFYVMFRELGDDYVVGATIYDSTMTQLESETLTTWAPHCIKGLEEPPVGRLGKYYIRLQLLDDQSQPVTNGPGDFNDRTWPFLVRRR
jgi:hypothetical protein